MKAQADATAEGDRVPKPAGVAGANRHANVDRLRLVALLDITYFHVAGVHFSIGLGLPIFLLFTAALNARSSGGQGVGRFVRRKVIAFMLPWFAWSVVYGAVLAATTAWHGAGAMHWFEPGMLLVGTQWHLWYLVFGLFASLVAFFVHRLTARVDSLLVITLASLIGCFAMLPERIFADAPPRAMAWLMSLPSIPIGIALGRCFWEDMLRDRIRNTVLMFGIVFGGMAALEIQYGECSAERYMAAMVPVSGAVLWRGRPDALTTWLTRQRLGVYLIHPLVIHAFSLLLGPTTHGLARTIAVVVVSLVGVWLLSKTPLSWMVRMGGETEAAKNTPSTPVGGGEARGLALNSA